MNERQCQRATNAWVCQAELQIWNLLSHALILEFQMWMLNVGDTDATRRRKLSHHMHKWAWRYQCIWLHCVRLRYSCRVRQFPYAPLGGRTTSILPTHTHTRTHAAWQLIRVKRVPRESLGHTCTSTHTEHRCVRHSLSFLTARVRKNFKLCPFFPPVTKTCAH